jgi:ACS family sodium-dependent inorganic phosphate cotransporter
MAWMPSYLKNTFNVSLASAGVFSAAPWLASFVMGNVAGYLADRLLRAGIKATFVRRLMNTIGLGVGGILLLRLPDAGSFSTAVLLMCCTSGSLGFCFAGFVPNSLDIAPRFADVIAGLSNTAGAMPGILGVYATGWLVDHTGSFAVPFYVTGGISLFGALVFLVFASGERLID